MSGELLGCAIVLAVFTIAAVVHARRTRNARPAAAPTPAAGRVPYRCATFGHYYKRAFSDRWQCAECGHLVHLDGTEIEAAS